MLVKKSYLLQKIEKYCNGIWKPNKTDEFKFLSNGMLKKITGHNKSMNTGKLSEWYVGEILRKKGINYKCQPIIKYNLNKIIPKNNIINKLGSCLHSSIESEQTGTKLGFKNKIKRITRSSSSNILGVNVASLFMTGSNSFTGPLTRSKSRLLYRKKCKLTKDTKNTPVTVLYDPETTQIQKSVKISDDDFTVGKSSRFIQPDYYLPDYDLFIEVKSRSYNCNGTASEKLDHIVRKYSKLEFTDDYKNSKLLIVCSAYELFEESTSELLNYNNKTSRKYIKDFVKLSKQYNILDWIPIYKINNYL
ncbi:MAG: hypothetical protein EBX50_18025 [Chitinophagia bacterium]|nr:hypothetical protein [Chitinophagia bacterium]